MSERKELRFLQASSWLAMSRGSDDGDALRPHRSTKRKSWLSGAVRSTPSSPRRAETCEAVVLELVSCGTPEVALAAMGAAVLPLLPEAAWSPFFDVFRAG